MTRFTRDTSSRNWNQCEVVVFVWTLAMICSKAACALQLANYSFGTGGSQTSIDADGSSIASDLASPIDFTYSAGGNPVSALN